MYCCVLLAPIMRFPLFVNNGLAQEMLHCLPCPFQEVCGKETQQRVGKVCRPILREASAQSSSVIKGVSDRLVCCCCFHTAEKLLRLRKEVEVLKDEFDGLMKRSAEERGVDESSSDLNRLEELASVPSTPP